MSSIFYTDLIQSLVQEMYQNLPMPEKDLYIKFNEVLQGNVVSMEILNDDFEAQCMLWEKIILLNYDKFQENQERIIFSYLPEIKEIIDDKGNNNLENTLQKIDQKIQIIFDILQNDITNFIRLDEGEKAQANIIAWSKSIFATLKSTVYENLKSSKNKLISNYMKNSIEQFSIIFKDYINIPIINIREHLDCYKSCQEIFENYMHNHHGFTPKFILELLNEDLKEFVDEKLDDLMTNEIKEYLDKYKIQISNWKYYTNSEALENRKETLMNFKVNFNKKYGWVPCEIMKETVFRLNKMMCEAWKNSSIQHKNYMKEVDIFTKEILVRIISGGLNLFDSKYCMDWSIIAYFMCSTVLGSDQPENLIMKFNETAPFLNINHFDLDLLNHNWVVDVFNPIEAQKKMSQIWLNLTLHDKEDRYFFLFCMTLISSNLHYIVCPQLEMYGAHESSVIDFEWLRNTLKLAFQSKDFTSFKLGRQDNPILICQMMLKTIVNFLVKSKKLQNDNVYKAFTNYIDSYVEEITSQRDLIGLSKTIKDNFIRIKQVDSETVTMCVSGFLSEENNQDTDWLDLVALNEQGTTYDYKWKSGSTSKLIYEIFGNIISWLTTKDPQKRSFHMSHYKRVKTYLSRRKENIFFKLSSYINPVIGCPFSKSTIESQNAGKHLAKIIKSNTFDGAMINLVAFSLGCNVLFHCLMKLSKCERKMINNVILMGGASRVSGDWSRCRKAVNGRMINAYSRHDWILKYFYRASELENPIGLTAINVEGIENVDVSEFIFDHMDYRKMMDLVLYEINYDGD